MELTGIEQRSEAWFTCRLGKATASKIKDIIAKTKSGPAATRKNYAAQLVVERMTGQRVETFTNAAMQWGTETEPEARWAYELVTGNMVDEIAFIQHPEIEMAGASPDGLIEDDGMLELKCPNTATHIEWMLAKVVPSEHIPQMAWQLACTGRKWCDFVSYDPRMPEKHRMFLVRYQRDDAYIKDLEDEVVKFLIEVSNTIEKLEAL